MSPQPSPPAAPVSAAAAIAALEAQRAALGDATVDAAIAALRAAAAAGATEHAAPALRQVSVLMLDVVGSTRLVQRLDAEDAHGVLDPLLAEASGVIGGHGGKVMQYAGDSVLAVFGAEAVREDDAERALRAGLELLALGRRHAERVRHAHGHEGLDVRVGVHSGTVLLGAGVDGPGSVRGVAVHIAARLEQSAPPGALLISADTHALARGLFEVEALPPITAKGLDAPLRAWRVTAARAAGRGTPARGIEGVATAMVGRDAELARLLDAAAAVQREGRARFVTVIAEAGLGKSRLLDEFARAADPEGRQVLWRVRLQPVSQGQPYALLREALAGTDLGAAGEDAPLLAHLIGGTGDDDAGDGGGAAGSVPAGPPREMRRRAFAALHRLLRTQAAAPAGGTTAPRLLLLDDLHWADAGSLDALAGLPEAVGDLPLLVLAFARPALDDARPAGLFEGGERIVLAPLAPADSARLVAEVLKALPEVPDDLRTMLLERAEGHPFYLEELVKMLLDEGAITVAADGWRVERGRLAGLRVPPTLTGVLQARLDALPAAERRALQQASAVGFVFWDGALEAIDSTGAGQLPAVQRRALVVPHDEAALPGARGFAFHHHLLQQVTYGTLLAQHRRQWHARVGAWLAAIAGPRGTALLGLAADHFERAGDLPAALEFHRRAASHAEERWAHATVIEATGRALALAAQLPASPELDRQRWMLHMLRHDALASIGEREAQRADAAELTRLADSLGDLRLRFETQWRHMELALRTADYKRLLTLSMHGVALGRELGDPACELRALQRQCIGLTETGQLAASQALADEGLARAEALGLLRIVSLFLNMQSVNASLRGDVARGHRIEQRKLVLERTEDGGTPLSLAMTLGNMAVSCLEIGDLPGAREHAEQSLALFRSLGDAHGESLQLLSLAGLCVDEPARFDEGLAQADAALALGERLQSGEGVARALAVRAALRLAAGDAEAACRDAEAAERTAREADIEIWIEGATLRAQAERAAGRPALARAAVQRILDHLDGGGSLEVVGKALTVRLACYEALAAEGDPRADTWLDEAHALVQHMAAGFDDAAMRERFLSALREVREIEQHWAQRAAARPA